MDARATDDEQVTLAEFEAMFLAQWRAAWARSLRSDGEPVKQPIAGWLDSMRCVATMSGFADTEARSDGEQF